MTIIRAIILSIGALLVSIIEKITGLHYTYDGWTRNSEDKSQ